MNSKRLQSAFGKHPIELLTVVVFTNKKEGISLLWFQQQKYINHTNQRVQIILTSVLITLITYRIEIKKKIITIQWKQDQVFYMLLWVKNSDIGKPACYHRRNCQNDIFYRWLLLYLRVSWFPCCCILPITHQILTFFIWQQAFSIIPLQNTSLPTALSKSNTQRLNLLLQELWTLTFPPPKREEL